MTPMPAIMVATIMKQVGDGEPSFLARALFQLLPDHRVGRFARGFLFGSNRGLGDTDVQVLDHDGARLLQAEASRASRMLVAPSRATSRLTTSPDGMRTDCSLTQR